MASTAANNFQRDLGQPRSNQINLYIDGAAAEGEATIRIYKGELEIGAGTFEIRNVAPAIFFVGDKVAAAFALTVNADSSRTQEETFDGTLAPRGIRLGPDGADVYLLLFGTGIRAGADNVTATVAGESVPVLGAVAHSTFMGLDQVNIGPLPRTLAGRGVVNIVLTVDGVHSNEVRIKLD